MGEYEHAKICHKCRYLCRMTGRMFSGADWDGMACHYTLLTDKFREVKATDTYCPYFSPKRRERKIAPPAWDEIKSDENI